MVIEVHRPKGERLDQPSVRAESLRSENDFNRFLFSSSLEEVLGNLYDYTQELMDLHILK